MRPLASTLLVLALAGAAREGWALDPSREITRHDERRFGVRDGLRQGSVFALAQTPDGYLWIGTDGGLARFDGRRFVTWGSEDTPALRIPRVRALLVDRAGDLWIGTNGGTGLIRRHGGRFETFEEAIGRGGSVLSALEDRQGRFWFGTWDGVIELSHGRFTKHQALGDVKVGVVLALGEDRAGALWLGTLGGVVRFHEGRAIEWDKVDGQALTNVPALLADPEGGMWFGTSQGRVYRHDGAVAREVARAEGGEASAVRALVRDRQQTLWAATDAGLMRMRGARLEPATPNVDLREPLRALLEDSEDSLWIGTAAAGLVRLTHGAFATLELGDVGAPRVMAIAGTPDGTLWIGSGSGLTRIEQRRRERFTTREGLCTNDVWALAVDGEGRVWVGGSTSGVVCRLDPATGRVARYGRGEGLAPGLVRAITVLPDGHVWVGSVGGLYQLQGDRFEPVRPPGAPTPLSVYAIHRDRAGALWVGGKSGLHVRREGTSTWSHIGLEAGLPNELVFSIEEDEQGALWLGTLSGFARVRDGRVTAWKQGRGFTNDPVFKVMPDAAGNVWLCSPRGVLGVSARALAASAESQKPLEHVVYGTDDGLAADQCEGGEGQSAGWRGGQRAFWFPSGTDVSVLDPARVPRRDRAANALVEELLGDGRAVEAVGRARVPPGRGDLQIAYTAPRLAQPDMLTFRYRLDPFDDGWVEAGSRRIAFYTQVPPGAYTFRVVAVTDGRVAGPAAALDLAIAPHWWQTKWFRLLALLATAAAAAATVVGLHRRRVRAIEERHQAVLAERTRIARDLHDTLAQSFTGISVQLEAADAWTEETSAKARECIDKARALARTGLSDARRAVWALRPEATERVSLVRALSEIARSLSASVPVRLQVNGEPRPLPPAYETGLLRIGQEALTNAVRHAQASNIAVDVSFLDDSVLLKVADDGRGFDPARGAGEPGHFGLEALRERTRALGGGLEIKSRPGAGTEIAVRAPLPRDEGESTRS